MEAVSTQDIEALTEIANRLPGTQSNELLELIESWSRCSRRSPRTQYNEQVSFKSEDKQHFGKAKDLSTAGIFIEGPDRFEIGDQVRITLDVSISSDLVDLGGTVVRHTESGIGIRFNYESPQDKDLIDALIGSQNAA
ncbi:PilZ domain protein [Mariprofundus micogutta]|uniref:PilZ domain protein n=1 Tax=Mariprofundus micogutta TaxID=1921010 RepID=A0A1L8CNR2_9PROT|nr:PilZ domain-containing protein [Mariprofundus micogutta]GAV20523.1 PilZ domain protein [Mariprofundus micogutta]